MIRRRRIVSSGQEEGEVNITPLLDIVFILLIFFIVTATFLNERGIELVAPEDNPPQQETRPPPMLVLSVQRDGFVQVDDGRTIDPRSVAPVIEEFRAREPEGVVMVNAAPEARAETTVLVLDQSRLAGVEPAITLQRQR